MAILKCIYYWLYSCESVRVENCAYIGHYYFGRKYLHIGKFLYKLWN